MATKFEIALWMENLYVALKAMSTKHSLIKKQFDDDGVECLKKGIDLNDGGGSTTTNLINLCASIGKKEIPWKKSYPFLTWPVPYNISSNYSVNWGTLKGLMADYWNILFTKEDLKHTLPVDFEVTLKITPEKICGPDGQIYWAGSHKESEKIKPTEVPEFDKMAYGCHISPGWLQITRNMKLFISKVEDGTNRKKCTDILDDVRKTLSTSFGETSNRDECWNLLVKLKDEIRHPYPEIPEVLTKNNTEFSRECINTLRFYHFIMSIGKVADLKKGVRQQDKTAIVNDAVENKKWFSILFEDRDFPKVKFRQAVLWYLLHNTIPECLKCMKEELMLVRNDSKKVQTSLSTKFIPYLDSCKPIIIGAESFHESKKSFTMVLPPALPAWFQGDHKHLSHNIAPTNIDLETIESMIEFIERGRDSHVFDSALFGAQLPLYYITKLDEKVDNYKNDIDKTLSEKECKLRNDMTSIEDRITKLEEKEKDRPRTPGGILI